MDLALRTQRLSRSFAGVEAVCGIDLEVDAALPGPIIRRPASACPQLALGPDKNRNQSSSHRLGPPGLGRHGGDSSRNANRATDALSREVGDGEATILAAKWRHDPCVLPRAVPMVEAMGLLVLADHWLRQRAIDILPPLDSRP